MYQPSGCGVFGILRKPHAPKVSGEETLRAITRVRHRGSELGAGFAVFNADNKAEIEVRAYVRDPKLITERLNRMGVDVMNLEVKRNLGELCDCVLTVVGEEPLVHKAIRRANEIMWEDSEGRIYSIGRALHVMKGVGFPEQVAREADLYRILGDLWLAHTRQPTNSPGYYPFWSHPFSGFDVAVVHNGDVSSFGANVEFLRSRGVRSFVGTDSEVIALLFEELLNEGLSVEEATQVLVGAKEFVKGSSLDGPFTAVIGYYSGDDLYMIVIADRAKFRPAVVGEDENYIFAASEESEIRELSTNARVWTLRPGGYMIASLNRGIIRMGRESMPVGSRFVMEKSGNGIDVSRLNYKEINELLLKLVREGEEAVLLNAMGPRFLGINLPRAGIKGAKITVYGTVGNCMANLNNGNNFYVYGNVGDDAADTMHDGRVVIVGDARDVLGQAFQGGEIFVRGNVGNRAGIQMREYKNKRPYLVIGGTFDDYLGEYMGGGVILVFNKNEEELGNHVGSGMVGGRIFVRGHLSTSKIGVQPNPLEVERFLRAMVLKGVIDGEKARKLSQLPYYDLKELLPPKAREFAIKLFEDKAGSPKVEYRHLSEKEREELLPIVAKFSDVVKERFEQLLEEKYTVISRG
ncbi:glutamate synthase [Sulfodiicoccus acidiphilus]|nr:glutamate synthase [Sulfodiicoccus acidiphilus]